MVKPQLLQPTAKEILKAVFWNRWGVVTGSILTAFGVLDFIDSHFSPRFPDSLKNLWGAYYVLPSLGWRTWITIAALGLLVVAIHGAYAYATDYYQRYEKLTEHKLILEMDQGWKSHTNVKAEHTKTTTCIFATLDLRFDNNGDQPVFMKSLKLSLHRRGEIDSVFMWFSILQVMFMGTTIKVEDFEPMRVAEHQLTPMYSVEFALSTPAGGAPLELDANYYLRISMESSGYQRILTGNLHPDWKGALDGKGTNQIAVTGDVSTIPEDYTRIY
jgi:hypothetical protein